MTEFLAAAASAIWLGILTSVSPCPLTTNLAAVSFLGQRVEDPRRALLGSLAYVLGRCLAYTFLGGILVASLLSVPALAHGLQKHVDWILGVPSLLAGLALLGLVPVPDFFPGLGPESPEDWQDSGPGGAFLLGILFAASFCPTSAVLFFGSLLPLATTWDAPLLFPALYGLGTGLPVAAFAILLAFAAHRLSQAFEATRSFQAWASRFTGWIFLALGGGMLARILWRSLS